MEPDKLHLPDRSGAEMLAKELWDAMGRSLPTQAEIDRRKLEQLGDYLSHGTTYERAAEAARKAPQ